jgi:thiamine-phosphate pyrophosphorylase
MRPMISLVTGATSTASALVDVIAAAARAGIDWIQIREPGLDDRRLLALTRDAVAAVRGTPARILVNGRPDIALAAEASGVHLRANSMAASRVRPLVPREFVIGRSVHSPEEAMAAEADGGCDYLIFGTVFASASKPPGHPVAGLDALGRVCASVRLPVLAIGGVTIDRAPAVASAGAAGVAAIGLFADAADLSRTVAALRNAFDT